jgi:two-component system phosphate regulon response regulator OmpR
MTAGTARILIVEDDVFQRQVVQEYLSSQGFSVVSVADAAELRGALAGGEAPDLAILDIGLPGEDGLSLARWLRVEWPRTGIIMLTAANDPVDRVVGLECGADDYVTKPFEPRELLARIRAVLRRAPPPAGATRPSQPERWMRVGAVLLDPIRGVVRGPDGAEDALTVTEFDLLRLLVENPNRPLHRDWLLERTTPEESETLDRAIDIRVLRLRRRLEFDPAHPQVIRTVRGVGYMFVPGH